MQSFDYDWTLVNPKDGKTFPSDIDDWMWMYSNIPEQIKQYYEQGFMIVVFTNQSKSWKCEQIQQVMSLLQIPLFIVAATDKTIYKPNTILFDNLVREQQIDKSQSFYVGDALGRKSDFSDSDKIFAENIGVKWYSPEDIFAPKTTAFEIPTIITSKNPEVIIMMGYPGSGKSTIAANLCLQNENYVHIAGDIYKTLAKMRKVATEHILQNNSVVFDATHSSIKKRKEIVDFAKKHNYETRCIHVNTPLGVSYIRNNLRDEDKRVPKIAYSVYKKYFEPPNQNEGFELLTISV